VRIAIRVALVGVGAILWGVEIPAETPAFPSPAPLADGCLDPKRADNDPLALIRGAIDLVESTGHEPSRYRLELRTEDALQPDVPTLDAERVDSVIFVPREPDELYPLRVNRMNPCAVGWVLRPFAPTVWQRRVIDRATAIVRESEPVDGSRAAIDVQVLESDRLVGVRILQEDGQSVSVTLRKSDLTALEP
jgi:hypothetical protein